MPKVRVAVIGAGGIGSAHLQAYADWPDLCEIVGIADLHLPSAEEKSQQFGAKAFASYEHMLDETRPDAVSICTPPNAHLLVAQAAAERNLSVLCEKPPARTVTETEALIRAMAQSNGILQFAFCHRFHQTVLQAQELIASGKLGRIIQIYNRFGFRFERVAQTWFSNREVAGGGVLIDTLVHSVDIFRALVGQEIIRVSASTSTTPPLQVEDSASILVTSANGVMGSLNCSWATPISEAEIRIYGTEGEAVIDYGQPGGLRYCLAGTEWSQLPFDKPNHFTLQAEHFLKCAASGRKPLVTGEDALAVMRVIEAAYESVEQGRAISL